MRKQKLVRLSSQQMDSLKNGDTSHFVKNLINLGVTLGAKAGSIQVSGPFNHDTEDEQMFIVEYEEGA